MSKRVFVVDDPNVASEVETLLRSRGLCKTDRSQPSMNEIGDSRPTMRRGIVNDGDFPFFKRISQEPKPVVREVNPLPFSWRDGVNQVAKNIVRGIMSPIKRPYEMSCGTFTPPTPSARLFVNGGCGGFQAADAHDLMSGRQLYRSNGCGGFEPITQSYAGCGGRISTPSFGGCGGGYGYSSCGGSVSTGGCGGGYMYRSC